MSGFIQGTIIGVIQADTGSLDCSSCGLGLLLRIFARVYMVPAEQW